jgi:hypothetical protein
MYSVWLESRRDACSPMSLAIYALNLRLPRRPSKTPLIQANADVGTGIAVRVFFGLLDVAPEAPVYRFGRKGVLGALAVGGSA